MWTVKFPHTPMSTYSLTIKCHSFERPRGLPMAGLSERLPLCIGYRAKRTSIVARGPEQSLGSVVWLACCGSMAMSYILQEDGSIGDQRVGGVGYFSRTCCRG
jgi:hypothetical protein